MYKKVNAKELEFNLKQILNDYGKQIDESVVKTTDKLIKQAKADVVNDSNHKTGAYKKGWSTKTEKGEHYYGKKIYNKKKYRLTHLLEFGHRIMRNGQCYGRTRAFPNVTKHEIPYSERLRDEIIKEAQK